MIKQLRYFACFKLYLSCLTLPVYNNHKIINIIIDVRSIIFNNMILDVCITPLGMEHGVIRDNMISASSESPSFTLKARWARLNSTTGSWYARTTTGDQWIQVAFGGLKLVSGVILQGSSSDAQWVTAFKIRYYDDVVWKYITDASGDDRVRE